MGRHAKALAKKIRRDEAAKNEKEAEGDDLEGMDEETKSALEGVDTKSLAEAIARGGKDTNFALEGSSAEGKIGWEFPICYGNRLTGHKLRHLGAAYAMVSMVFAAFSLYKGINSPLWSVTEGTHMVSDYITPWDGRTSTRTYAASGIGPVTSEYAKLRIPMDKRSHPFEGVQQNRKGICAEFDLWPECPNNSKGSKLSYLVRQNQRSKSRIILRVSFSSPISAWAFATSARAP
jgi:hypothetical protein